MVVDLLGCDHLDLGSRLTHWDAGDARTRDGVRDGAFKSDGGDGLDVHDAPNLAGVGEAAHADLATTPVLSAHESLSDGSKTCKQSTHDE